MRPANTKTHETTFQLENRYTQMILFLTRTTDMTRTELDISKPDLMRDTIGSTLQIIIAIITNIPH